MLLKKQTVWLLTMLSLVVVLSVYYVTSDPGEKELAAIGETDKAPGDKLSDSEKDTKVVTDAAGDEAFEAIRMQIQDKRSEQITDLTTQLADADLTADEKLKIAEQKQQIQEIGMTEQIIEQLITSTLGYSDALVRADKGEVVITVKASEGSKKKAAEILKLVRNEIGTGQMAAVVQFDTN